MANALGVPPDYMIEAGREHGIPVAALVGAKEHAVKQVNAGRRPDRRAGHRGRRALRRGVHAGAGARGAGSHRGDRRADVPVLAAGGIVTGTADGGCGGDGRGGRVDGFGVADHRGGRDRAAHRAEDAGRDVAGHRAVGGPHGKAVAPTGVGLDRRLAAARRRAAAAAAAAAVDAVPSRCCAGSTSSPTAGHPGAQALATYFVGQGVGLMNKVKPAREVVLEFIEDYLAAAERLSKSLPD